MVEIDYVVYPMSLTYSGTFNLKELYSLIRSWFNERGFPEKLFDKFTANQYYKYKKPKPQ